MKTNKIPQSKYKTNYKGKDNYSAKTIDELALMLESHNPVIVKLNGVLYRIEEVGNI